MRYREIERMSLASVRSGLLAACAAAVLAGAALAQPAVPSAAPVLDDASGRHATPSRTVPAAEYRGLPPDTVTRHVLELPGRTLRFAAKAGSIEMADFEGRYSAEMTYIDYRIAETEPGDRPVTFVVNGGPGASSAWLQLGALGPWRLSMADAAALSSVPPSLVSNAESWLSFTDLVFIDPVGTGYSGFARGGDEARRQLWSVDGDIRSIAAFVRLWVERNGRAASPKFLVGESYGGFRGPRLVRALQREHGMGITGLVLVSPVLDFAGRSAVFDPLALAARLPTLVAVGRASAGPVSRDDLGEAERYAAGDYIVDLVRGVRDPETLSRISGRVAALTGLDPDWVERRQARPGLGEILRQLGAPAGRVVSAYDATVTRPDPFPSSPYRRVPDPVLDALAAPLGRAMLALHDGPLNWRPEGRRYEVLNRAVSRNWNWGEGNSPLESVSSLRRALALDPRLRVVIAHGLFDLVTPYFASQIILDQIPLAAGGDRIRLLAYPGGHMFYANDRARAALRDEGMALIGGS